ncbi:Transmembrane protein [Plasmodiophora brassicae]
MASTVGAGSVGNALSELNAGATAGDAASGAGTLTALSYDDDRGGVVGRVVRTVDAFKSGLVGVLYIMAHRSVVSNTADAIYVSIGCIQLIAVVLPHSSKWDFHLEASVNTWSYIASLSKVDMALIYWLGWIPIYVSVGVVAASLLNGLYVGYSWRKKNFHHFWTIRLLRKTAHLLVTILYVPILGLFTTEISMCQASGMLPDWRCSIVTPIMVVLGVVFAGMSLMVAATFFEPDPTAATFTSRSHSRIDVLHNLFETVLVCLSAMLEKTSTGAAPMAFALISLACTGTVAFLYTWYQPYYRTVANERRAVASWLATWTVLAGTFARQVLQPTASIAPLFFGGYVFIVPLAILCTRSRRALLSTMSISDCRNEFEVELCCRIANVDVAHKTEIATEDIDRSSAKFVQGFDRFPSSIFLCIFYSMFLQYIKKSPLIARRYILRAVQMSPTLDQSFFLYQQKRALEDGVDCNSGVLSFVQREKYIREAKMLDQKCCRALLQFWGELLSPKPDMLMVVANSNSVSLLTKKAGEAYANLLRMGSNSPATLYMYAGFLETIVNSPDDRALCTSRRNNRNEAHLDEFTAAVAVSASERQTHPVGTIVSCNVMATILLGEDVTSRWLGHFLLPPWNHAIPIIATEYLEHGVDRYFGGAPHLAYCRSTSSAMFPVHISLTPFSTNGIDFDLYIAIVPATTPGRATHEPALTVLADPETGLVHAMTNKCIEVFNTTRADVSSGSVSMFDLVDEYRERRELFMVPGGATGLLITPSFMNDVPCELHLSITACSAMNFTVDVIAVEVIASAKGAACASDVPRDDREFAIADTGRGADDDEKDVSTDADDVDTSVGEIPVLQVNRAMGASEVADAPKEESDRAGVADDDTVGALPTSEAGVARGTDASHKTSMRRKATRKPAKRVVVVGGASVTTEHDDNASEQTSNSGVSDVQSRIVRQAMIRASNKMDPALSRFHKLFLAVLLLTMAMVVSFYTYRYEMVASYAEHLARFKLVTTRRKSISEIALQTHTLLLLNQGGANLTWSANVETVSRAMILSALKTLQTADSTAFQGRATLTPEHAALYLQPTCRLLQLVNEPTISSTIGQHGLARTEITYRSLYDVTSIYVNAAIEASKAPLSSFVSDNPVVFLLCANVIGAQSYYLKVELSTRYLMEQSRTMAANLGTIGVVISVFCVALITSVLTVVLLPIAKRIEESKRHTLEVLTGMPSYEIVSIRSNVQNRLETVHGISMLETNAIETKRSKSKDHVKGEIAHVGTKHQPKAKMIWKWSAEMRSLIGACLRRAETGIMLRVGAVVVFVIVYFSASSVSTYAIVNVLHEAPVYLNHAGFLRKHPVHAMFLLQMFASGTRFQGIDDYPALNTIDLDTALSHLDLISDYDKWVLYGNAEEDIAGLISGWAGDASIPVLSLLMADGCTRDNQTGQYGATITPRMCRSFLNGVMAGGMHPATIEFIRLGRSLAHRIDQTTHDVIAASSTPNSTGVWLLIPSDQITANVNSLQTLRAFCSDYLYPAFSVVMTLFQTIVDDTSQGILSKEQTYLVAIIIALILHYAFVVRRLISSMDYESKRTRMLLLLIPDNILNEMENVKQMIVPNGDEP